MKAYTIHKPTHRWFSGAGALIAVGQLRGSFLVLNRFEDGVLVQKSWAVESCARHLTNYGKGLQTAQPCGALDNMQGAWRFTFGDTGRVPVRCERLEDTP